ncbi:hypothetical protein L7F22_016213, partial [Adiantum nelumboides]|nr:hypothetical protein [Adiantum nelumboides]
EALSPSPRRPSALLRGPQAHSQGPLSTAASPQASAASYLPSRFVKPTAALPCKSAPASHPR